MNKGYFFCYNLGNIMERIGNMKKELKWAVLGTGVTS